MQLVGIVLGWLLGLLSQPIVDGIRNPRVRRQLKQGLRVELAELRPRLALNAGAVRIRAGTVDLAFIEWSLPIIEGYRGHYAVEPGVAALKQLRELLKEQPPPPPAPRLVGKSLTFKKFRLPLLASEVPQLQLLGADDQRALFEIEFQVQAVNEEIDLSRFYFEKTFERGIDEGNLKRIHENIDSTYVKIGEICTDTADMIGTLLAKWTV